MRGINSHAVPVPLFLSIAFFTHFSFYEKEREGEIQHVTRRKSREPGYPLATHEQPSERFFSKRERKQKKERKKIKKKYICVASVLSVLEEQLVLQGLPGTTSRKYNGKGQAGFNYTLYHWNKRQTRLDIYKSDVYATNDVFFFF